MGKAIGQINQILQQINYIREQKGERKTYELKAIKDILKLNYSD